MQIVAARVQGLAANLLKYRSHTSEPNPVLGPVVFDRGEEVPLEVALQLVTRTGAWRASAMPQWGMMPGAGGTTPPHHMAPASVTPTQPPGIKGALVQDTAKACSEWSSNASTTCGRHDGGLHAAEPTVMINAPWMGRGSPTSSLDDLDRATWTSTRRTPAYAEAQHKVVNLLQQLQRAGAF